MNPEFSVVIPTYLRPSLLIKCLDALSRQQLSKNEFEIIVVDDGDDRTTAEIVKSFRDVFGIEARYLAQAQRRGPAAARNRGWRAARGRIVAFTDDDCQPQPEWLSSALTCFKRGAQVMTGQVKVSQSGRPTHQTRTAAFLETAEFVTANCFCLRSALERVGGFTEEFDIAWREDSDLQFKFIRAGIPVGKCPEALVIHPLRPARLAASLHDERKNSYDALLYKRHPELFKQRIPQYRGLVLQYYISVLSLAAGLAGLLTGLGFIVACGLGIWTLLTCDLLVRRLPDGPISTEGIREAIVSAAATPFLSIYWRLHGAFKYRVLYW